MSYTKCVRAAFNKTFRRCEPHLSDLCGSRFGVAPVELQRECFRRLWLKPDDKNNSDAINLQFRNHRTCVSLLRESVKSKCQHLLQDFCQNRSIRVMKTVRATMESMEPLIQALPNFRVIHLVRDPRSVTLSRRHFKGYVLGMFSGNDTYTLTKEAKLFCNTVIRDIKVRQELEKKYPGKIYTLNFDEVITNTTLYLESVYRFFDVTPHKRTVAWLTTKGMTNRFNKTAKNIARQWQSLLSFKVNKEIVESCREFYDLIKFNWEM